MRSYSFIEKGDDMLTVQDITYSYDGINTVLNNVSFTAKEGDFLCVIGPNGCGKTTLLKSITRYLNSTGSVVFNELDLSSIRQKERSKIISYFSQNSSAIADLSIKETVMLGRYPYLKGLLQKPNKEDYDYVDKALKLVELEEIKDRSIQELSGGQLQRVFLAQIIAQDTDIILLDEPTNHLDLRYQIEILDFLKSYCKENNKVLIGVFHDVNIVRKYADNILLLNEGYLKKYGNYKVLDSNEMNQTYKMNIKNHMLNMHKEWLR